jgi:hypothetical protein
MQVVASPLAAALLQALEHQQARHKVDATERQR